MKTLYNAVQQYEGILDPDQNKVIDRMKDDAIRQRILEYCAYDHQKYKRSKLWCVADPLLKITKVDKDDKGWYIETESSTVCYMGSDEMKSLYDFSLSQRQQIDEQKGFLIKGTEIYFRWHKHHGELGVAFAPKFESTDGLPEELGGLYLQESCADSQKLDVHNNIKAIILESINNLKISGKGCQNVIISSFTSTNITVPSSVKIHRPKNSVEYYNLIKKFRSQYATT